MCVSRFAIRFNPSNVVQNGGKRFVFAPCGHCEDCLNHARYAWAWRLTSDLQYYVKEKNYKVGFITLTYNDKHLPHFPTRADIEELNRLEFEYGADIDLKSYRQKEDIVNRFPQLSGMPCFSKKDTEDLILYIRKVGFRKYRLTDIVYFLASEYGPFTKRPHYHAIFAWDGSKCSAEQFHELIRHYWCEYKNNGFISPARPEGGESKKSGKKYMPFEVRTVSDCMYSAFYTAKYVTKDYYFMRDILDKVSYKDLKYIKEYLPHHRQKKSLGFMSVSSLSDDEKIDLLLRGKVLLGNNILSSPPSYVKNKLLFKPCYIFDKRGNRLVSRECSDFLKRNFQAVISSKLQYFDRLFERMRDPQFWITSGLDESKAFQVSTYVKDNYSFDLFGCSLSEAYVFYYGMKHSYCFTDKKLTFLNRFTHPAKTYSFILIDRVHYANIQEFFSYLMTFTTFQQECFRDENVDFVTDYFNSPQSEVC